MTDGSGIVRGIHVGGVYEISPALDKPIQYAMRKVVVGLPRASIRACRRVTAEGHRPQAEGGNAEARRPEIAVFYH